MIKEEAETSKQLCLGPAMHWRVVPTYEKTPAAKGTVRFLPHRQDFLQNGAQEIVQFWITPIEQNRQIDALGIVVQLAPVDREPW